MKKTRIVSLFLALALSAGVLTGCAGKTTSSNAPTPSNTGSDATSTAPAEKVQLKWARDGKTKANEKAVFEAINKYIGEKIGVEVTYVRYETDYTSKLAMEIASGNSIDMAWLPSWNGQASLIEQNAVLDITDMLKDYPDLYNSMAEKVWKASEYNGRRYLIPNLKEIFYGYSLATPKEFADKVKEVNGFDFAAVEFDKNASEVENYKKLEKYMEGLKQIGVEYPAGSNLQVYGAMGLAPTHYEQVVNDLYGVDTKTNKVFNAIDTDEYEAFCRLMNDWNQKGYIPEEAANPDWNGDTAAKEGKVGLYHWSTTPDNQKNCSTRMNREMLVAEITDNYVASSSVLGSCYAISAKTKNADACLKFFQLLETDKTLADLYCYGIEGEDYTRISDDVVEPKEDAGWSSDVWCSVNVLTPSIKNSESADKKEQYRSMNDAAVEGKTLGFSPDLSALATETTALANVNTQYKSLLERGLYDPDSYLPEYRQALKDAQIDKVVAEIQKQYDEWLKTKK